MTDRPECRRCTHLAADQHQDLRVYRCGRGRWDGAFGLRQWYYASTVEGNRRRIRELAADCPDFLERGARYA